MSRIFFPTLLCAVAFALIGASRVSFCEAEVIFSDDFTRTTPVDNPWSCVNSQGQITAMVGSQLAVDDSGNIHGAPFGPSLAVGDLNGDGLPDIVMADSRGFLWYFQNHGTKDAPKFTNAEVMPLWFGDPCPNIWDTSGLVVINVVPKIQLVDFAGDGKLDLVVGNYLGKLYYIRNQGSAASPMFKVPTILDDITIATHRRGKLWCNYLAPFLYDWHHNGHLDLIMGDGSYSANSIFCLTNKGSNDRPEFTEDTTAKVIPGMGREHLVPQVVSWNGDGKADVLTTERTGFLNIFLNQGDDPQSGYPTFDEGHHVLMDGQEKRLTEGSTVTMANLTVGGLPDLLIGTTDGRVYLSKNTGKANDFQFAAPVPLIGTDIRPKILNPVGWWIEGGYGSPYDLLVCTNAQVEPGFAPPRNSGITSALRFYIDEPAQPNSRFPEHFYPKRDERRIIRNGDFSLTADTDYSLSFWVRTTGAINDLRYGVSGIQYKSPYEVLGYINMSDSVSASDSWNQFTTIVHYQSLSEDRHIAINFHFEFYFTGKGSVYISALKLEKSQ
jgi:hypothetical protein